MCRRAGVEAVNALTFQVDASVGPDQGLAEHSELAGLTPKSSHSMLEPETLKTSFLIVFGAGVLAFVMLLVFATRERRGRIDDKRSKAVDVIIAGLAAINSSGLFGLGWFALVLVVNDGMMFVELSICAALFTFLALFTGSGVALANSGKVRTAIALLSVSALPTFVAFGFLIYLDAYPIDWR